MTRAPVPDPHERRLLVQERRASGAPAGGNPPGVGEAIWAIPGALAALGASYWYGAPAPRR